MSFDIEIVKRGGKYWSCRDLQWGMLLIHDSMSICCIMNDNVTREGSPFFGQGTLLYKGDFSDIKFNEEFFQHIYETKLEYIRKINDNESSICTNCPALLYREWAPAPKLVLNRFTFGNDCLCNSNCMYCSQDHTLRQSYSATEFVDAGANLGYIDLDDLYYVSWGGGEPTISAEYEDMFRRFAKTKIRNQTITSAIKFSEQLAKLLAESDNDVVKMITSIDSGTRETYKKIKRVDQFDKVVENIDRYYKSAKVKSNLVVKYIVLKENCSYDEINSFFDLLKNKGWNGITVSVAYNFLEPKIEQNILLAIEYLVIKASLFTGNIVWEGGVSIPNFQKFETEKLAKLGQIEHFAQENGLSLDEVVELVKNNKK